MGRENIYAPEIISKCWVPFGWQNWLRIARSDPDPPGGSTGAKTVADTGTDTANVSVKTEM